MEDLKTVITSINGKTKGSTIHNQIRPPLQNKNPEDIDLAGFAI